MSQVKLETFQDFKMPSGERLKIGLTATETKGGEKITLHPKSILMFTFLNHREELFGFCGSF